MAPSIPPTGKPVAGPDTTGEAITDRPGRRVTLLADTEELTLSDFEYGPGELEITFESGPLRVSAGTLVLIPRGIVHSFGNTSDAAARFLNIHAPSCGFGDYLRGQNPGFDQHEPPPDGGADPASVVVRTFDTNA